MNLKQKLILLILTAGIFPALVIGLISLQNSRAALEQQIFDQLEAQRTIKANQITQHFASAEHDIQTLADNLALMSLTGMLSFFAVYIKLGQSSDSIRINCLGLNRCKTFLVSTLKSNGA